MALDFQYDELMLANCTLRNQKADGLAYGFAFTLRYPSYRGTFLSCIEALHVTIDGVLQDPAALRFALNGKQFLISELPVLCKEYWFVLDDAEITVMRDTGIPAGEHCIEVELVHRIPYTGYFGEYLTLTSLGKCAARVASEPEFC